jgi:hypothetical protein
MIYRELDQDKEELVSVSFFLISAINLVSLLSDGIGCLLSK